MKEMEFLLSEASTFLMPALPFIFSSQDGHVIPLSVIERGQLPHSFSLTKLFWAPDIEGLRHEFVSVKELGAPAVEEWQKGLSTRGADQRTNVAKWEKYAESGGVANMRTLLYPGYRPKPAVQGAQNASKLTAHTVGSSGVSISSDAAQISSANQTEAKMALLKSTKKAEIERRALLLHPPLTAAILTRLPVFHAALETSAPLDDIEWEVLKPQLLAQTAEAEKPLFKMESPEPEKQLPVAQRDTNEQSKAKEAKDADWDEIQGPVRLKILKYADEAIVGDWDDGEKVTKDNAPSFAADVLLHVRKRFYGEVKKEAASARATGHEPPSDPPQGPFTQKLTLENMKYVFDVKVKPITGSLRKELFLCNACDSNTKFFGFEGVIQHYAAKHTTALSVGIVVVHWRAEWPATPPFKPNPRAPKGSAHPLPAIPPQPKSHGPLLIPSAPSRYKIRPRPVPAVPQSPLPAPPALQEQVQPLPYSTVGHGQPYGSFPYGANASQPPLQDVPYPHVTSFQPIQQHIEETYRALPHGPYMQNPAPGEEHLLSVPDGSAAYRPPTLLAGVNESRPADIYNVYQISGQVASHSGDFHATRQNSSTASYSVKLNETARHARELWKSMANLKELPGVLRIFAIIYHLDKFFRSKFDESLPLTLFIDGLSNHKDMRPVRNINELPCKACYLGLGGGPVTEGDRKLFSFPRLVDHFQSVHARQHEATYYDTQPLDWMTDMLLLPHQNALDDMLGPGGNKFPLVSEAVKGAMRRPGDQPRQNNGHPAAYDSNKMQRDRSDKGKAKLHQRGQNGRGAQKRKEEAKGPLVRGGESPEDEAGEAGEEERLQEEAIRAMWAADRAQAAILQSAPAPQSNAPRKTELLAANGPGPRNNAPVATHASQKPNKSQKRKRKAQSPPRGQRLVVKEEDRSLPDLRRIPDAPGTAPQEHQEDDLLGALETHLSQEQAHEAPTALDAVPPRRPGRVVYVDEYGREIALPPQMRQPPYEQERYAQYTANDRRADAGYQGRPVSPPPRHMQYAATAAPAAPVERRWAEHVSPSSTRRYAGGEQIYTSRSAIDDDVAYERLPPSSLYYPPRADTRQVYRAYGDEVRQPLPPPQPSRPAEYETHDEYEAYELVRVIHPDGDYYVRRPVWREQPIAATARDQRHGGGRYYGAAPAPIPAPYKEISGRPVERREYADDSRRLPLYEPQPTSAAGYGHRPGVDDSGWLGPEAVQGAPAPYSEEYDPRLPSGGVGPPRRPEANGHSRYQ